MDSAIDLFRAGATVPAREIDHVAAATMRIVCPKCMERVHLVVRDTGSHFAHEPQTDVSPGCPLRSEFAGELLCETCHDERLGEQGAVIQELS